MSHLKTRPTPFEDVVRLLKAYDLGTRRPLAAVIGKSDFTAGQRIKNPGDLTLNELRMICKEGHVPAEKIREAIKFS